MNAQDIAGIEYDWVGCDRFGHVAFFSTAGAGYPPAGLLQNVDLHDAAIDALLQTPPSSTGRCVATTPGNLPNPWQAMMERGLFAYDSHPNGGPYARCAVPGTPATLASLPEVVQRAARTVAMPAVDFRTARVLDRDQIDSAR
jgi:hypothetical protein